MFYSDSVQKREKVGAADQGSKRKMHFAKKRL